jgi:hypothetical protein
MPRRILKKWIKKKQFYIPYLCEYYKNLQISTHFFYIRSTKDGLIFCYYDEHDILNLLEEHAIFKMIKVAKEGGRVV